MPTNQRVFVIDLTFFGFQPKKGKQGIDLF